MNNKFVEMAENDSFKEFIIKINRSANYFVALQGDKLAINLCMAYAFEAGLSAQKEALEKCEELAKKCNEL